MIEIMILRIGFNEKSFLPTRPLIDKSGLDLRNEASYMDWQIEQIKKVKQKYSTMWIKLQKLT
ncbi:protein of unknown function [Shewanella benthica]|uniref:Uncharacterized protein n=1 Tax=Shewanella benthica TaxID=43661 RepID=A0A330M1P7_9GAMM|nr:protein of unknown function [Shewanella benthica]